MDFVHDRSLPTPLGTGTDLPRTLGPRNGSRAEPQSGASPKTCARCWPKCHWQQHSHSRLQPCMYWAFALGSGAREQQRLPSAALSALCARALLSCGAGQAAPSTLAPASTAPVSTSSVALGTRQHAARRRRRRRMRRSRLASPHWGGSHSAHAAEQCTHHSPASTQRAPARSECSQIIGANALVTHAGRAAGAALLIGACGACDSGAGRRNLDENALRRGRSKPPLGRQLHRRRAGPPERQGRALGRGLGGSGGPARHRLSVRGPRESGRRCSASRSTLMARPDFAGDQAKFWTGSPPKIEH